MSMLIALDPRGIDLAYPTELERRSGEKTRVVRWFRLDLFKCYWPLSMHALECTVFVWIIVPRFWTSRIERISRFNY